MAKHILDYKGLRELADRQAESYAQALPFPHIVLDNIIAQDVLDKVLEEFSSESLEQWHSFNNSNEIKLALNDELEFGEMTRRLVHELNSGPFLRVLEKLTGIEGIVADPDLSGGGLHCIKPGGKLAIHADFNKQERIRADRRLNLLIYLNKDWEDEWGGHFELWDTSMTRCEKKVAPIFNRMVIFTTTSDSFHGHPDPLECPPDRRRRSIALYYYTFGRPEEERNGSHSTLFRARPGETDVVEHESKSARQILKSCIPPILLDAYRKISSR